MKNISGDKEVRIGSRTLKADMELTSDFGSICTWGRVRWMELEMCCVKRKEKYPTRYLMTTSFLPPVSQYITALGSLASR